MVAITDLQALLPLRVYQWVKVHGLSGSDHRPVVPSELGVVSDDAWKRNSPMLIDGLALPLETTFKKRGLRTFRLVGDLFYGPNNRVKSLVRASCSICGASLNAYPYNSSQ